MEFEMHLLSRLLTRSMSASALNRWFFYHFTEFFFVSKLWVHFAFSGRRGKAHRCQTVRRAGQVVGKSSERRGGIVMHLSNVDHDPNYLYVLRSCSSPQKSKKINLIAWQEYLLDLLTHRLIFVRFFFLFANLTFRIRAFVLRNLFAGSLLAWMRLPTSRPASSLQWPRELQSVQ
jgi:hypothetical protein